MKPSQLDLLTPPAPDKPGAPASPTSSRAAMPATGRTDHCRAVVLAFVRSCGARGCTDEEIQLGTGLNGNTQRPRRGELVKLRLIRATTSYRPTRSGKDAIVWVARRLA